MALASGAILIANLDGTLRYDPGAAFSHLARGQAVADTFSYTAADRPRRRRHGDRPGHRERCGRFDSLDAGQTDHDSFTYRVSDGHGGTDDATITVAISGKPDSERLVDSFEAPFLSPNRTSSVVTTEGQYHETDGAHGLYRPTDGQFMARLEAYGTTAQKVGSETISKLESFLGIPDRSLPKDSVDNTFAANGSAFKLKVSVQAGDEISFDWMFDARDFVNSPPDGKADNDFAVFAVAGGAGPELFKLSDIRQTGDQSATGWRS